MQIKNPFINVLRNDINSQVLKNKMKKRVLMICVTVQSS